MLRITRNAHDHAIRLRLEGRLLEPWLGELNTEVNRARALSRRIELDLAELRYVDPPSTKLLRELIRAGAAVVACSIFVAELLHVEAP